MSNEHTSQALTRSDRIEGAIDKGTTSGLQINRAGQVNFVNANEIMEFAKMMALGRQAIPAHLRESPGACLAVCIQASSWQMSPFAVANKSYVVNDRMAYEAQIIAAVILMRAPIIGRLKYTYKGEGPTRQCTCSAKLDDGEVVDYTSPMIKDIKVKNSPLWVGDPDQQLAYSAARALARRHFPDVILGVYTPEEMAEETLRDVTPVPGKPNIGPEAPLLPEGTKQRDPAAAQIQGPQDKPAQPQKHSKPEKPNKPQPQPQPQPEAKTPEPEPAPGQTGGEAQPAAHSFTEEERLKLVEEVNEMRDKAGITMAEFKKRVSGLQWAAASDMVTKYQAETLQEIKTRWQEVLEYGKEQKAE